MHTEHHIQAAGGVDSEALDRQITETYRDIASEEPRPARPGVRSLGEALDYPPRCAHGMNSLTDRDYGLALARLRRG